MGRILPILAAWAVIGCAVPALGDEAPAARRYWDRLDLRIEMIEVQMDRITDAADRAATAIVGGAGFGVRGDAALASELSLRAGAMFNYDGRPGRPGDVILYVLYVPGDDARVALESRLADAAHLREQGSVVIGIASVNQLRDLGLEAAARSACDVVLDNLTDDQPDRTPNAPLLNAAVAWTWQCELFAACARRDKVAVVRQSELIDTKYRRLKRYLTQPFHHDRWLDTASEQIAPGSLGREYLRELRAVLLDVGTASWPALAEAIDRAVAARRGGGVTYVRAGGPYAPFHVGGLYHGDPEWFIALTGDESDPGSVWPGLKDFVLAIGGDAPAGSAWWHDPHRLRAAGLGVAWVVNGVNTSKSDLQLGDILIDTWSPMEDGVVKVENYDARLGPVSSITAEAVYWAVQAEVDARLRD